MLKVNLVGNSERCEKTHRGFNQVISRFGATGISASSKLRRTKSGH